MARSAAQIAAGQRRSLIAMQEKVIAMAAEWGDVDNQFLMELEELADQVQMRADFMSPENMKE